MALDRVGCQQDGHPMTIEGRVVVQAQDGGLMVQSRDGVLWTVEPQQKLNHTHDDVPFTPFSADELAARLLGELPQTFSTHRTAHYLICYDTSREYAQWCGALFEQLYRAFANYWTQRGFRINEPEFPLVAIVFADRAAYAKFARAEVGAGVEGIIGYFSLRTNRMTMYDLTGIETIARQRSRRGSPAEINHILAQPDAERTVATIVHEATHQIAYNCGLHTRFSDCPLWFAEGIAIYFETPDLNNPRGWRNVGGINRVRWSQMRDYLSRRPADSLRTLLVDDQRFRDTKQAADAYAEAWSLTYFLIRQHSKQYFDYLKLLSEKKPLVWDTPEERLAEFTAIFGDLRRLDAEFVRYMIRLQ
jgi:hypothetical protein